MRSLESDGGCTAPAAYFVVEGFEGVHHEEAVVEQRGGCKRRRAPKGKGKGSEGWGVECGR